VFKGQGKPVKEGRCKKMVGPEICLGWRRGGDQGAREHKGEKVQEEGGAGEMCSKTARRRGRV
jgi:hypothetical protein